jgi:hypothetical protein
VGEEQKDCDPTDPDDRCGDYRDHVALDPEHEVVLAVVPGARAEENAREIVAEVKRRLGGRHPGLMTSDEYPACAGAIEETFGEPVAAPPERKPGRPPIQPESRMPDDTVSATAHEHREGDRVIAVGRKLVFGAREKLEAAPGESTASCRVNTSFIERQNGTDRGRDARKARKSYRFSEGWRVHEAMTHLTMYSNNVCWCVRALRGRDDGGSGRPRWRPA